MIREYIDDRIKKLKRLKNKSIKLGYLLDIEKNEFERAKIWERLSEVLKKIRGIEQGEVKCSRRWRSGENAE